MPQPKGRYLPLSLPRRLICDLLHFARQVPTVPVQRRMHLAPALAVRNVAVPRPSWAAIFTKAYGFVAGNWPELRRAYLSLPAPRLYEHPVSVASVAVERPFGDENAVFFGQIRSPEKMGLRQLDAELRRLKEQPIESIASFRRALLIGRLPRPLRRLAWWLGLNLSGRKRAHYLGTFGVSVYGSLGASSLHPLSPLTTALNYGHIGADGVVDVRIIYDHRVMDGATVARVLEELEQVLTNQIVTELRYLKAADAA
jgi:hypothetical protein